MTRPFLLALALALTGCAHYQMACPAAGGPQWRELTSAHFTLRTDLPEADAEKSIREAEEVLANFGHAAEFLLPPADATGRTSLVLFSHFWEYQKVVTPELMGQRYVELGRFVPADERGRPTIALSTEKGASAVFRHELMHRLLHQRLGEIPHWLHEGLAEYFSVASVQNGKIGLGALPPRVRGFNYKQATSESVLRVSLFADPLPPVEVLLREDGNFVSLDIAYLGAWTLVHYLANGAPDHADRFRKFLVAVANHRAIPELLTELYGPIASLDAAYRTHLTQMMGGKALQWFMAYTPSPGVSAPPASRLLDDGEVHQLKASLQPALQTRELELAQKHAGSSPATHRWLAQLADGRHDDAGAEREIERAVGLAADPFYRYERMRIRLAHELGRPERERHLDALAGEMRAVAHFVSEPDQLDTVARYFRLTGEDGLGWTFAERAIALDPQCAGCLATLAKFYFARGALDDAVGAQEAALQRWPAKTPLPPEMSAQLERYRCARAKQQNPATQCQP
jgi:hypothetical protein